MISLSGLAPLARTPVIPISANMSSLNSYLRSRPLKRTNTASTRILAREEVSWQFPNLSKGG